MDDVRLNPPSSPARISRRQLFWLIASFVGATVLGVLAIIGWEIAETQRIVAVIEAHEGYVNLRPDTYTVGDWLELFHLSDAFDLDDEIGAKPLFRSQVIEVSAGFSIEDAQVDFSLPVPPGEPHPLAVLERLPNLEEVTLQTTHISAAGTECLARCRRLSTLSLGAREITADQMQELAASRSLKQLDLDLYGGTLTGSVGRAMQSFSALESLSIWRANIDALGIQELSQLKSLRELNFVEATFDQTELRHLAGLPRLQTLRIWGDGMKTATFQSLGRLTGLRLLALGPFGGTTDVDRPAIDMDITELTNIQSLSELTLRSARLSNASIESLLKFAKLETLRIESTDLTDEGALKIANGLTLRELNLCSPKFVDPVRVCNLSSRNKLKVIWRSLRAVIVRPGHTLLTENPK